MKHFLFIFLFTSLIFIQNTSQIKAASITFNTYTFGFDLRSTQQEDARQYLPFLDYLKRETGYNFKLRFTLINSNLAKDLSDGKVDFAAVGAVSFLEASKDSDAKILVRGLNKQNKDTYQSFIVVKKNSSIKAISDLKGKKLAFGSVDSTQGHLIPRIMLDEHNLTLNDLSEYIYTGSHQKCAEAVITGQADACGMQDTLALTLVKEGLLQILSRSDEYPSSGIAASSSVPVEVQKKVIKALLDFKPNGKDSKELYNWHLTEMPNGFVEAKSSDYKQFKQQLTKLDLNLKDIFLKQNGTNLRESLTEDEKNWLKEHPVIKVSNELDWPPFDFVEKGKPAGFSIDYLTLVAKKAGFKIEWVNGYTWSELEDMARNKKLDLLQSISRTPKKEKEFLFTNAYVNNPKVIFTRSEDVASITSINDLAGKRVAAIKGFSQYNYLVREYPEIITVAVNNVVDGLTAVIFGKADAYIDRMAVINHAIKENNLNGLEFAARSGVPFLDISELSFAVRDDWPELVTILEKGMAMVTEEEYKQLSNKWLLNESGLFASLTKKELTWLAEHPQIRLGFNPDMEPWVIVLEDGTQTGALIELYKQLEAIIGIDFEIEIDKWPKIIDKARNRELDVLMATAPNLSNTLEMEQTLSIFDIFTSVYARKDRNFSINTLEDLKGLKIAVHKGEKHTADTLNDIREYVTVIEADSTVKALTLTKERKTDITLAPVQHTYILDKYLFSDLEQIHSFIEKQVGIAAAVRNDWPELTSIINKGLQTIGMDNVRGIMSKWSNFPSSSIMQLKFSQKEKEYLKSKGKLTYCFASTWKPYDYLEDGVNKGIFSDYMKLYSQKIGIPLEPVIYEKWIDSYNAAVERKCDIYSGLVHRESREKNFSFTKPYFVVDNVLIASSEKPFISSIEEILDKPIGTTKGTAIGGILKDKYPNINLKEYPSAREKMKELLDGEVYAIPLQLEEAITYVQESGGQYKVIAKLEQNYPISVAVRNDEPELLSIFEKAVDSITIEEANTIKKKWTQFTIKEDIDLTIIWEILGVAALLLLTVLYISRKKIKQSNEKFKSLFNNAPLGIALVNEKEQIVLVNEAFCKIIGYTQKELTNKLFTQITHPDDCQADLEQYKALLSKKIDSYSMHKRYIKKDGSIIWVDLTVSAIFNTDKSVRYAIGMVEDITERIEIEREKESLIKSLKEAQKMSHTGSWEWNIKSNKAIWSDELYSIYGYDKNKEPDPQILIDQCHPDYKQRHIDELEESFKTGYYESDYRIIRNPDKEIRDIYAKGEVIYDENQNPLIHRGTIIDITELKTTKFELEKQKEIDQLKSMFIASMSHELRTPLNSIIGFSGMMIEGLSGELNEEQEDNINRIYRAGNHLLNLITDVIDISKIEAGRIDVFPQEFSLEDIINEAIETITPMAEKKKLELKVESDGWSWIYTDKKLLYQCLLNFLSNAVKFTEKGSVTVIVSDLEDDVRIAVKDTGIGIDKSDFSKLFEAFEQLDNHLRVKAGGTGLGLYLTKQISENLLNGSIEVESQVGEGSIFTIQIPKKIASEQVDKIKDEQ